MMRDPDLLTEVIRTLREAPDGSMVGFCPDADEVFVEQRPKDPNRDVWTVEGEDIVAGLEALGAVVTLRRVL